MKTGMNFGNCTVTVDLPDGTDILQMPDQTSVAKPDVLIRQALDHPIGSPTLPEIIRRKGILGSSGKIVIVVSDHTRPVPYKRPSGILWPIIETLQAAGIPTRRIILLVATGTHAPMDAEALRQMLDERVVACGIPVCNHDCADQSKLVFLGKSSRGNEVYVNRLYMEADLKILTGLVESHFMAGASGGRKSICPGIIGERGTFGFHGAGLLSHANARDLVLDGNPVHEQAVEIADMAGADFIVNVTLNRHYEVTGVFAGNMHAAHRRAVEALRRHVGIPCHGTYDLVVTHGGFVGVNHYQCAKAAVAALPVLQGDSILFLAANTTDAEPVGSKRYRKMIALLKRTGADGFMRRIMDDDWEFVPDQWQAQMWAKVFQVIPPDHFFYFSPYLFESDQTILPGCNAARLVEPVSTTDTPETRISVVVGKGMAVLTDRFRAAHGRSPRIACLADGPYGVLQEQRRNDHE